MDRDELLAAPQRDAELAEARDEDFRQPPRGHLEILTIASAAASVRVSVVDVWDNKHVFLRTAFTDYMPSEEDVFVPLAGRRIRHGQGHDLEVSC